MKQALFRTVLSLLNFTIFAVVKYFAGFEVAVGCALACIMTYAAIAADPEPVEIRVVHAPRNQEEGDGNA